MGSIWRCILCVWNDCVTFRRRRRLECRHEWHRAQKRRKIIKTKSEYVKIFTVTLVPYAILNCVYLRDCVRMGVCVCVWWLVPEVAFILFLSSFISLCFVVVNMNKCECAIPKWLGNLLIFIWWDAVAPGTTTHNWLTEKNSKKKMKRTKQTNEIKRI